MKIFTPILAILLLTTSNAFAEPSHPAQQQHENHQTAPQRQVEQPRQTPQQPKVEQGQKQTSPVRVVNQHPRLVSRNSITYRPLLSHKNEH